MPWRLQDMQALYPPPRFNNRGVGQMKTILTYDHPDNGKTVHIAKTTHRRNEETVTSRDNRGESTMTCQAGYLYDLKNLLQHAGIEATTTTQK